MNKKLALALLTATQLVHAQTDVAVETPEIASEDSIVCIDTTTLTPEELALLKKLASKNKFLHIVSTVAAVEPAPVLPEIVLPAVEEEVVMVVVTPEPTEEVTEVIVPTTPEVIVEEVAPVVTPEVVEPVTPVITEEVVTHPSQGAMHASPQGLAHAAEHAHTRQDIA